MTSSAAQGSDTIDGQALILRLLTDAVADVDMMRGRLGMTDLGLRSDWYDRGLRAFRRAVPADAVG